MPAQPELEKLPMLSEAIFEASKARTKFLHHLSIKLRADGIGLLKVEEHEIRILEIVNGDDKLMEQQKDIFEALFSTKNWTVSQWNGVVSLADFSSHAIVNTAIESWVLVLHKFVDKDLELWEVATLQWLIENREPIKTLLNLTRNADFSTSRRELAPTRQGDQDLSAEITKLFENCLLKRSNGEKLADQWDSFGVLCFKDKLEYFISQNKPILFILPAFPIKSANKKTKVLSDLPDMGEKLAVERLDTFLLRLNQIYKPGGKMIIFGDGRVYNDILRVPDSTVTLYKNALLRMLNKDLFEWVDLDLMFQGLSYPQIRQALTSIFGSGLEAVKNRIKVDKDFHSTYLGFRRFMKEDLSLPMDWSSSQKQKHWSEVAKAMMSRTDATGHLIRLFFPNHVRLSIHASENTHKFSIKLVGDGNCGTPWHNCPLKRTDGSWTLIRRKAAESDGFVLKHSDDGLMFYEEICS